MKFKLTSKSSSFFSNSEIFSFSNSGLFTKFAISIKWWEKCSTDRIIRKNWWAQLELNLSRRRHEQEWQKNLFEQHYNPIRFERLVSSLSLLLKHRSILKLCWRLSHFAFTSIANDFIITHQQWSHFKMVRRRTIDWTISICASKLNEQTQERLFSFQEMRSKWI